MLNDLPARPESGLETHRRDSSDRGREAACGRPGRPSRQNWQVAFLDADRDRHQDLQGPM